MGGSDDVVIELNERALLALRCPKELVIVPGATHLFEEPGALDRVAALASGWFLAHLGLDGDEQADGGHGDEPEDAHTPW